MTYQRSGNAANASIGPESFGRASCDCLKFSIQKHFAFGLQNLLLPTVHLRLPVARSSHLPVGVVDIAAFIAFVGCREVTKTKINFKINLMN